jgi:hypothetical protein
MPAQREESTNRSSKALTWGKLLTVAVFIAVAGFFLLRAPTDVLREQGDATASATAPTSGEPPRAGTVRCHLTPDRRSFRVGGDQSGPVARAASGGEDGAGGEDGDVGQRFAPFAVVLGRGIRFAHGFAVGVRRDTEAGAVAGVAVVDPSTGAGRLVDLGRSRGDVGAPLLAPAGDGLVVAMLEPNAGGFAVRLARIAGSESAPSWGDDLPQGRDESLAYDLATSDDTALVVWDEANRKGDRTRISVAALDTESLRVEHPAAPVSSEQLDAELPRIVPRGGGYWLVYVARHAIELPPNPSDDDLKRDPKQERYAAEMIEPSWLEAMPLEANGRPAGPAHAFTPERGHVQAFDVERGSGDSVVVAWRDDDTPTGAQGGRVSAVVIRQDGIGEVRVIADEDVGLGVPNLLPRWVSLAGGSGVVRLAPLDAEGLPRGALLPEPVLGRGQLIAANDSTLLLAQPSGQAVDLTLAACDPEHVQAPTSPDGSGGGQ